MIEVTIIEKAEGTLGVKTTRITFLGVPIFRYKKTTTNNVVVKQLTPAPQPKKIVGFRHETENKSKKNK